MVTTHQTPSNYPSGDPRDTRETMPNTSKSKAAFTPSEPFVGTLSFENSPDIEYFAIDPSHPDVATLASITAQFGFEAHRLSVSAINDNSYNSNNFKVTLADGQSFVMRRCIGWRTRCASQVEHLTQLAEYLSAHGLDCFVPLRTQAGQSSIFEGDHRWMVTSFVELEERLAGRDLIQVAKCGAAVGEYHSAAADFSSSLNNDPDVLNVDRGAGYNMLVDRAYLQATLALLKESDNSGELHQLFSDNFNIYQQAAEEIKYPSHVSSTINSPQIRIHNDLCASNFLVKKDGKIIVSDFEKNRPGSIVYDFSSALFEVCRQSMRFLPNATLERVIQTFIEGYCEVNSNFRINHGAVNDMVLTRALQNTQLGLRGHKSGLSEDQYQVSLTRAQYYLQALKEARIICATLLG